MDLSLTALMLARIQFAFRVNCSYAWSQEIEQALEVLVRALGK